MKIKKGKIMNKAISRFVLYATTKLKPVLIKVLPINVLRTVKRKFVNKSINDAMNQSKEPFIRNKFPDGINVIGFVKGEIGLGQSCRLLVDSINHTGIDFTIYNYEQISSMRFNDNTWDEKITNTTPYNINLIHLNPPDLALAYATLPKTVWNYKYNIAFWLWELEEFPEDWERCFSFVDEIWTPSNFASNSIRKKTNLPVHTFPYPISTPVNSKYDRKHFNLPEKKFLFLCMYDSNSTIERKNPIGAIEAFKKAFSKDNSSVGLVIKVNNPQNDDIEKIRDLLIGYENIYIIPKIMIKIEVNSLIKNCNAFISLHRAEGFGLPLAEAMLLGVPSIATNWSANTEFMNNENACMVGYELITLGKDYVMYKKGNRWAEPNINQAAMYMKKLFEDEIFYNDISIKAQNYIKEYLNLESTSKAIQSRINNIYDEVDR